MEALPFIFSNQAKWRIFRHFVFWFLWFAFQAFLYSFSPSPILQNRSFLVRISMTAPESLIYLLPHMFLAYALMFIVITRYVLKGKYFKAVAITTIFFLITAAMSGVLSMTVINSIRQLSLHHFHPTETPPDHPLLYEQLGIAMLAGLRGSITIGGLAAAIKLMKCIYEKEQAALSLEKEKVSAELQMLKAQLHPHFLFNTLNNIYSYTQNVSLEASTMILGLSELLRYMLYDCNQPFVPLEKELKMLRDYINLEKVRYDDHLDLSVNILPSTESVQIAPLLLLPLVENCFKHGASKMIQNPWISIDITLNKTLLTVKLVNGKVHDIHASSFGIGTANTKKRLDLIYAGKYDFQSFDQEDMYIVNLKIGLDCIPAPETETLVNPKLTPHEYRENIQLSNR
jgi:sensor histidine kinase YesM